MANENNRVSIDKLEAYCKENNPDVTEHSFTVGDETVTYTVKYRLSLEESLHFIEDVVSATIMEPDCMTVPLAQRYIMGKSILTYYANFTVPENDVAAYELVLGAGAIIGEILNSIDGTQYQMLVSSIRDRIDFESQKMISTREWQMNVMQDQINAIAEQWGRIFDGIGEDQIISFIASIGELSKKQFSTEELANALASSLKSQSTR